MNVTGLRSKGQISRALFEMTCAGWGMSPSGTCKAAFFANSDRMSSFGCPKHLSEPLLSKFTQERLLFGGFLLLFLDSLNALGQYLSPIDGEKQENRGGRHCPLGIPEHSWNYSLFTLSTGSPEHQDLQ